MKLLPSPSDPAPPAFEPITPPASNALPSEPASVGLLSRTETPWVAQPLRGFSRPLSESTAFGLSLASTAGSWGMLFAGLALEHEVASPFLVFGGAVGTFLGPSVGHWYRGSVFTGGMGLRVLGVATAVVGVARILDCPWSGPSDCHGDGIPIIISGGLAYLGGTLYDIVAAPFQVRKHNKNLKGITVAPIVTQRSASVTLGASF